MARIRRNAPKVTFTIDCDEQEMEFIKQGLDDGVWTEGDAEEEVLTALQSEVKRATATPAPAKKKR